MTIALIGQLNNESASIKRSTKLNEYDATARLLVIHITTTYYSCSIFAASLERPAAGKLMVGFEFTGSLVSASPNFPLYQAVPTFDRSLLAHSYSSYPAILVSIARSSRWRDIDSRSSGGFGFDRLSLACPFNSHRSRSAAER